MTVAINHSTAGNSSPSFAPSSGEESERLAALARLGIIDTPPEQSFDDLARVTARLLDAPFALITFVDATRQWYKARIGIDLTESAREHGFCNQAIQSSEILVIPDAATDARFAENPRVKGAPWVRFYAGAPLVTAEGHRLGTLCVLDTKPRTLSIEEGQLLVALSRQVVALLALREAHAETRTAADALRASEEFKTRLIEGSRDCIKTLDLEGRLLSINAGGMSELEICDLGPVLGSSWIDFWEGDDRRAAAAAVATARSGGVGRFVGFFATMESKTPKWWDVIVSPILGPDGNPERILSLSRDVTESRRTEAALRAEVEARERLTALLQTVHEGSVGVGERFFPAFIRHLAVGFDVPYAFVTECLDGGTDRVRMLAFWQRDRLGEPVEFDVAGTPCQRVMTGQTYFVDDRLQELFPNDRDLVGLAARSYVGLPLLDGSGAVIGHLALLDVVPMAEGAWAESALQVCAARAAAEVERLQADRLKRRLIDELAQAKARLHAENVYLRQEIEHHVGFEELIGESQSLKRMLTQIEQVAPTDATVLILGETGTGKELVARAIHSHSARSGRRLLSVNCGAISPTLVESELFGHERGAFTGAVSRRIGRFEVADGGTIFLDEIGDLSLDAQVRLLRVLQEGEITRVGSSEVIKVDVRVIAATHRDLPAAVRAGTFRHDLYYRLNVFPIRTPALRDRVDDIPLLAEHFTAKYAARAGKRIDTISQDAAETLRRYPWPGNIRELANVIERSVIVTTGTTLRLADWVTGQYHPVAVADGSEPQGLQDLERQHILKTLERTGWKVSGPGGAAESLNLKPTTLEARMKKLGIVRPR